MNPSDNTDRPNRTTLERLTRQIVDRHRKLVLQDAGSLNFVTGAPGSGVGHVIAQAGRRVARAPSGATVVRGTFRSGSYEPLPGKAGQAAAALLGGFPASIAAGNPLAAMALQLARTASGIRQAVQLLTSQEDEFGQNQPTDLLFCLHRLAHIRPVVLFLSDFHCARDSAVHDFLETIAQRVRLHRVHLYVGMETQSAGEAEQLRQRLLSGGLAQQLEVPRVSDDDLQAWVGPCNEKLVDTLLTLSDGDAPLLQQIWSSWVATGVAVMHAGEWRLVTPALLSASAAEVIRLALDIRIKRAAGAANESARRDLYAFLQAGAVEGEHFTADAVAVALDRQRDDVIDLMDTYLLRDKSHPYGILLEDGFRHLVDPVAGDRDLCMYRFAIKADWAAFSAQVGVNSDPLLARMRDALLACYQRYEEMAAGALWRICARLGDQDASRRFECTYRAARSIAALHDEVVAFRAVNTTDWSAQDYDRAAQRFTTAASNCSAPADMGVALDTLALASALADRSGVRRRVASVGSSWARALLVARQYTEAKMKARAVLTLAREIDAPDLVAVCLNTLALVAMTDGEDDPFVYVDEALRLVAPSSEVHAQLLLTKAQLVGGRGDLHGALPLLKEASRIMEVEGDPADVALAMSHQAVVHARLMSGPEIWTHEREGSLAAHSALRIARASGDARAELVSSFALACLTAARWRAVPDDTAARDDTAAWLVNALYSAQQVDEVSMEARILEDMADILIIEHRYDQALIFLYAAARRLEAGQAIPEARAIRARFAKVLTIQPSTRFDEDGATEGYSRHRGWEWVRDAFGLLPDSR